MPSQISLILPVYNGASYLRSCLESVQAQTWPDYELLIADDASTDETWSIIQSFTDPRWKATRSASNQGLFRNLNQLARAARAPLIHILCQDDLMEPDCLEREVAFFEQQPDIAMSFCKVIMIDESGAEFGRAPLNDLPAVAPATLALQYFYYYGCLPGNLSTVCVRKSAFVRVGGFDESFKVAGDFEMWARICAQGALGVLHRYLIQLRLHPGQLSRVATSYLAHVLETRRIRAQILPLLPSGIRASAARYTLRRQNVWDVHYALRCLQAGRRGDFVQIVRAMGAHDFGLGLFYWLISANNHLFRPTPRFVGLSKANG
jgi:glycosyltransferase involved in cell wall biosynthesis